MTQTETLQILAILKAAFPQFYRDMSKRDAEGVVALWARHFAGEDPKLVAAAVDALIDADDSGFPPNIGKVKERIRRITSPQELTEGEAWALVAKAIGNSGYGSAEEFARLPDAVRQIVGSPSQLREWSQMESGTVHSVVASNFQRAFRAKAQQRKEYFALSPDVRAMISGTAENLALEGKADG